MTSGCVILDLMFKTLLKNGSRIFSRRQSSIFSAAAVLAFAFSLSALLGIFRDRLLYARFYACCTPHLDAYNGAFRIPDIIFRLLVIGALSAAFIPVFSEQLAKNKEEAFRTASSVINILLTIFLGLSILVIIFSYPISSLIASGFSQDQIMLMSRLTRVMIIAQVFFLLSNFLTGILQTYQRFLVPALSPIIYNLGIIFGIQFLSRYFGIFAPALGMVIGAALHFLVQLPLVVSLGFRYRPIFSFRLKGVKKILRLMPPRTIALGLGEVEATIALFLASMLPSGSLSLLYLSQRLGQFFSRIFGVTIGQASLPVLSREAGRKRFDLFSKTLLNSLLQAVYLSSLAAVVLLVLRIPMVRLAYGAERFPWKATLITGRIVAFFAPLVVFAAINSIVIRGFYALQDTRTPLYISFFSLIINVLVAVGATFNFGFGVYGLALASTISGLFQSLVLIAIIVRRIRTENLGSILILPLLKIFLSGFLSGLITWLSLRLLDLYVFDTSRIVGLVFLTGVSLFIGAVFYLWVSLVLRITQAQLVLKLIRRAFAWPKSSPPLLELPPVE